MSLYNLNRKTVQQFHVRSHVAQDTGGSVSVLKYRPCGLNHLKNFIIVK